MGNNSTDLVSLIHFDGGDLLFANGHVKWRRGDQINPVSNHPEVFDSAQTARVGRNLLGFRAYVKS